MRHSVLRLLASGLLATLTPDVLAQPVPVVTPLLGQDTNQGDAFGWHAIINDGVAIVTAPGVERPDGTNGTIHAFRDTGTGPMGGWAQEAAFRGSRRAGIQALAYVPALGGAAGGGAAGSAGGVK